MVRAALGVLYLLASATANGWNLLKLGLSPGANHTHTDHAGSHPGPSPPGRGGTSRPVPEGSKDDGHGTSWWSVAFERAYGYLGADWWLSMGIKMLLRVAEDGISYCGTLCASIGLAAKWSYWLLTGVVLVFLLQLMVWTYTWVIHPAVIHSRALWRYCQGTGTWSDVTRLQGLRPFIPTWKGPGTGRPGQHNTSSGKSEGEELIRGLTTCSSRTGSQSHACDMVPYVAGQIATASFVNAVMCGPPRTDTSGTTLRRRTVLCTCALKIHVPHQRWPRCISEPALLCPRTVRSTCKNLLAEGHGDVAPW